MQWTPLIQALSAQLGGLPHLRITERDNSMPESNPNASVEMVGKLLGMLEEAVGVRFFFPPCGKEGIRSGSVDARTIGKRSTRTESSSHS